MDGPAVTIPAGHAAGGARAAAHATTSQHAPTPSDQFGVAPRAAEARGLVEHPDPTLPS
eukprot:SAG31_NODE_42654_length_270_cov_1.064327_1_plen_58_part_10